MGQVITVLTVVAAAAASIASLVETIVRGTVHPNPVLREIEENARDMSNCATPSTRDDTYLSKDQHPDIDPNAWVKGCWKKSMNPRVWPTSEEYQRAVAMTRDPEGHFIHLGISGTVKSGKSSLINSLRGIGWKHRLAAAVDVSECTRQVTRYEDPRPNFPFAWYDIPGSGTASCPEKSYFNSQGLFALDAIIVLVKDSFTEADAQLIRQCDDLCIPSYIVRSNSDTAIRNIIGSDDDDEDDKVLEDEAKALYVHSASDNIRQGLEDFSLKSRRAYLINRTDMFSVVNGKQTRTLPIHEEDLLLDILSVCKSRRLD